MKRAPATIVLGPACRTTRARPSSSIPSRSASRSPKRSAARSPYSKALGSAFAVFMKNHGVTFCGASIERCMMMGIFLERACKAQLLIASTGYRWDYPTEAEMKARAPQTFHSAMIGRSWDFYCRKLRWLESLSAIGAEGTYRIA